MTTTIPPRPTRPQRPTFGPRLGKASLQLQPPRIVVNAVEGWGKTTLAAYAPEPAILMARGETGFTTLRGAGLVPDCDCVELATWDDTLKVLRDLEASSYKTIVLDALNGFERLCHELVCERDFGGVWGEQGFGAYGRGASINSPKDWLNFLGALDNLRVKIGSTILILSHVKVAPFKNPDGPDYDRWVADCHAATWSLTSKWADAVLFGRFNDGTRSDRKNVKAKAVGGTHRVICTERTAAWDAKNRYRMPAVIDIPADPAANWPTVWSALTAGGAQPTHAETPDDDTTPETPED